MRAGRTERRDWFLDVSVGWRLAGLATRTWTPRMGSSVSFCSDGSELKPRLLQRQTLKQ
jgi:hypothetical protein